MSKQTFTYTLDLTVELEDDDLDHEFLAAGALAQALQAVLCEGVARLGRISDVDYDWSRVNSVLGQYEARALDENNETIYHGRLAYGPKEPDLGVPIIAAAESNPFPTSDKDRLWSITHALIKESQSD